MNKSTNNRVKLLKEEFAKYTNQPTIGEDGFVKIGKDLDIDIYSDIFILYFCFKCECKQFGAINLEEFSRGIQAFGVSQLVDIKKHIIKSKEDLLNLSSSEFKKFYYFLFEYLYDKKSPKKQLSFDEVELYFKQLFSVQFKIVDVFLDFLTKVKGKEGLKQDQWNCFLDFVLKIGDNFPKGYSTKDSWPSLLDEFYLDYCERNNIEINQDEEPDN